MAVWNLPPPDVAAAGRDFIDAWTLAERLLAIPLIDGSSDESPPAEESSADHWYRDMTALIERGLFEIPPPNPADLARFQPRFFNSPEAIDAFMNLHNRGMMLLQLRWNQHACALRRAVGLGSPASDHLLKAYRIDPEVLALGLWLHGRWNSPLLRHSGELSAQMLLTWAELYPNDATIPSSTRPIHYPDTILPQLLSPNRNVTAATRKRIVRFMENCPEVSYSSACPRVPTRRASPRSTTKGTRSTRPCTFLPIPSRLPSPQTVRR